jgi:phosphoenolpyruvate synthase/pyruvate phosphate dikinase
MMTCPKYGRSFEALGIGERPLAGSKNTSLGDPYRTLSVDGIRIPNGCAIATELEEYSAAANASRRSHLAVPGERTWRRTIDTNGRPQPRRTPRQPRVQALSG